MLDPRIQAVLNGTPIAHLATTLPDGSPHTTPLWIGTHGRRVAILTGPDTRKARNIKRDPRVALSLVTPDDVFTPVTIRGRVTEWIEGDDGWAIIDSIATKYTGQPYPRGPERLAALIEPEHQHIGVG